MESVVTNKAKGEVRDWGAAGLDGVAFSWTPEGGQRVEITPGQETGSKGPGAGSHWEAIAGVAVGAQGAWRRKWGEEEETPRPRAMAQRWTYSRCVRSLAGTQTVAGKGVGMV